MSDIARLGFVVDSADIRRATDDLGRLDDAAGQAERGVARASQGITGASGRIQTALGRSGEAWGKFRESFAGAGGVATAVGSLGASAAASQMIEAARAAEEAQALFDQVFQESAASVRGWSQDMAAQTNRSAMDLQGQAAMFQQVLASLVPDRAQAAEMSTTLAELAQDISAFYDISESDALAKVRSGLVGETEPLKQLGIILSATSVQAKALEMGLAGTAAELTEADKVAARYALIMERTADAQGAATREAESLTNMQKGLQGATRDLATALGIHLLPMAEKLVGWATDIVQAFNTLSPETQKFIAYAVGLTAAITPLVTALGLLALALPPIVAAFGLLVSPVGLVVAALVGIGVAVAAVIANWDELKASTEALVASALNWGRDIVSNIKEGLIGLYQAGVDAIADLARGLRESVTGLIADAKGWGADIASGLKDGISNAASSVTGAVRGLGARIKGAFTDEVEIRSPSRVFHEYGQNIGQGLADGIKGSAPRAIDTMKRAADGVINVLEGALFRGESLGKGLRSLASSMLGNWASKLFQSGMSGLFGAFGIPGFASGTRSAPGGLAMVGERGPELVRLPRGSQVHSNQQTRQMMRGGGGMSYSPTFNIGGNVTLDDLAAVRNEAAAGFERMQRALPAQVQQINAKPRRRY